jgi:SAM-dependent methyltransferase
VGRETKNILINRLLDAQIRRCAATYFSGRLVDIGCGTKPYEDLVSRYITEYIGVEHAGTPHGNEKVDIWATAYDIPVPDASFDSALCSCVLEHLEEPELALRECYRILKPGGVAMYEVPFIWHLHEQPRDFFRFSKFGVQYLFEKVGFVVVENRALTGFWGTFGQLFVYYLWRFRRGPLRWFRIVDAIGLVIQFAAYCADKIDKAEDWPSVYTVVARKPEAALPGL